MRASCRFKLATAALGDLVKICRVDMVMSASFVRASRSSKVYEERNVKAMKCVIWRKLQTSSNHLPEVHARNEIMIH